MSLADINPWVAMGATGFLVLALLGFATLAERLSFPRTLMNNVGGAVTLVLLGFAQYVSYIAAHAGSLAAQWTLGVGTCAAFVAVFVGGKDRWKNEGNAIVLMVAFALFLGFLVNVALALGIK